MFVNASGTLLKLSILLLLIVILARILCSEWAVAHDFQFYFFCNRLQCTYGVLLILTTSVALGRRDVPPSLLGRGPGPETICVIFGSLNAYFGAFSGFSDEHTKHYKVP